MFFKNLIFVFEIFKINSDMPIVKASVDRNKIELFLIFIVPVKMYFAMRKDTTI